MGLDQWMNMRVKSGDVDQTFEISNWRRQYYIREFFFEKYNESQMSDVSPLTQASELEGIAVDPEWVMELYQRVKIASEISRYVLPDDKFESQCVRCDEAPIGHSIATEAIDAILPTFRGALYVDDWMIRSIKRTLGELSLVISIYDKHKPFDSGVVHPIFEHFPKWGKDWDVSFSYHESW